MRLFNTTRGVVRSDSDGGRLLPVADLHDLVVKQELDSASTMDGERVSLSSLTLLPPVRPRQLVQVGLNYRSHLEEIGIPAPETMIWAVSEVTDEISASGDTVTIPADDPENFDHECEIALVIGSEAHNVSAADAWSVIAGVTACNDLSARGLQRAGLPKGDKTAGKMLPGCKPLGPGLITADEVRGRDLSIQLTVNGQQRQHGSSAELVFDFGRILEIVTAEVTLQPGDVVITGSPAGVGAFSGSFLQPGDVVEVLLEDMPPLRTHLIGA